MNYQKREIQRHIDEYLAETGRNLFVPSEFVLWLAGLPQHPLYATVFAKDDAAAAFAHRVDIVRRLTSGLRITVQVEEREKKVVRVTTREFPALVSPVAGRRFGGGYTPFDPDDDAAVADLKRQGITALVSWLSRYGGVMDASGIDISSIREIVRANTEGEEAA